MSKRGTIWRTRTNNAKNHGRKRQGPRTKPDVRLQREIGQAWEDILASRTGR